MILVKSNNKYYTYNSGWVDLQLLSSPTQQDFIDYGITNISSILKTDWDILVRPISLLVFVQVQDNTLIPTYSILTEDSEFYYALYVNSNLYTIGTNGWEIISENDIISKGMSRQQIESVTYNDLAQIFVEGSIQLVIYMKSNSEEYTPYIQSIDIKLSETFETGGFIIDTNLNKLNTTLWKDISSIVVNRSATEDSIIRYAFSNDNRNTWKVYRNGWQSINDISVNGMTFEEISNITDWNDLIYNSPSYSIDIRIYMLNNDKSSSPIINSIQLDYTTYSSPIITNTITVPVPASGFKNQLVGDEYELRLAEGIAFDKVGEEFDFYTTPDKIKVRPLNLGNLIGGRTSPISAVELINGYEDKDYDMEVTVLKDEVAAKIMNNYALLNDAEDDRFKTKVELSEVDMPFIPEYPLKFRLLKSSSKNIYLRVSPQLVYSDVTGFQLRSVARPVLSV